MKQIVTEAIILTRVDYGEADRILTVITPHYGKLSLLAKGVRRIKSKLAGGIELFSVSEITFIKGRGEIGTLVSTRLVKYYSRVVGDVERTMAGYEIIKQLNKITEDEADADYFVLLQQAFEALSDGKISLPVVRFWFAAQLLRLGGHTPNLQTDINGHKLEPSSAYNFSHDSMIFIAAPDSGSFSASHIKFLRLAFGDYSAKVIAQVQGGERLASDTAPLVGTMLATFLRL
ncbi:MAG TPA: DNA repair protein RecO [Patescibacteria group bacterium]|nr:DNA repair protein RecO [Patescibacteria group bacterium]